MPYCTNSGETNDIQIKVDEFSNQIILYRKETDSDSLHRWKQLSLRDKKCTVKAPAFTSFLEGSMTVEAAFVIPLFLFGVLAFLYLFEVMAIQTNIRAGMQYAGKKYAENACVNPVISGEELEEYIREAIGEEKMNRSFIMEGASGIDCSDSYVDFFNKILYLKITYTVRISIPVFGSYDIKKEESIRVKGWCGYESSIPVPEEQKIVYMTENGMVYHLNYHCPYLDLSIRMTPAAGLENLRNASGEKYYPCEKCGRNEMGAGVYVTNYGNRYHTSIFCSGIKRKIYAVPLSETSGKGVCSKCGK